MAKKRRRPERERPAPAPPPRTPFRLALLVTALAGLGPLVVYVATLSDTVAGGDAGEFITVSSLLGVAHPPGYPLYTLLGKAFTLLPVGTVAWRVNLLSAVADSAAALLLGMAVLRWTGDAAAGLLAAGVFAFGPLVWPYAITAEVFALNNLFAAGLVACSVWAAGQRATEGAARPRTVLLGALWLGLGFAHHHTLVFLGLPAALFLLTMAGRRALAPRFLAAFAGLVLLGMTPYLYLVAASGRAPVSWGDTASLGGFLTHVLRREYGTFRLAETSVGAAGGVLDRVALFWSAAARSSFGVGLALAALALPALRRPGPARRLVGLWTAALLFYVVVFSSLANVRIDDPLHRIVQDRFWQQGLVVLSALAGVGLAEVAGGLGRLRVAWARWLPAVALPILLVVTQAPAMAAHRSHFIRDYGDAILRSLPPHAVLVISSDEAVDSVRYVQHVEGRRADVRVIPVGFLTSPWFRPFAARHLPEVRLPLPGPDDSFSFRQFLDANPTRAVFVVNRVPWLRTLEEGYALWPVGLVEQVRARSAPPDLPTFVREAEASFARLDPARAAGAPSGGWEEAVVAAYWKQYDRFGLAVARLAAGHAGEPAVAEAAARAFEAIAARHPAPPPMVFKNLGVAYHGLAATRPDALGKMATAWRRYLAVAPPDDPDLPNIRRLVDEAERARR